MYTHYFRAIKNLLKTSYNSYSLSTPQFSYSTIYSLSSGHGKCGVSVIRVSGPNSKLALKSLVRKSFEPKPRYAYLKSFFHPKSGNMIDNGLVLWFPGPKSFTGEDCCEFQVHGSIAVVNCILDALSTVPECRLAKPGEYTKRSFYNGKLDLTEAEGLADLIHSETESQRKQALLQATGALSRVYGEWRTKIIRNIAHLEAYIDFAEEENIEDNTIQEIYSEITTLKFEIMRHLDDNRQGEILRHGVRTVIIGSPNVGKSSFMNHICQRDISIVTPMAGTTRDIIESSINIGGYPVIFADTAGLRMNTADLIEAEGISRAVSYIETADFVIILIDATSLVTFLKQNDYNLHNFYKTYLKSLNLNLDLFNGKKVLNIVNKVDLLLEDDFEILEDKNDLTCMSCKTSLNIDKVFSQIKVKLEEICGEPTSENPHLTKSRHRQSLNKCIQYINEFLAIFKLESKGNEILGTLDIDQDLAILALNLKKVVRCIEEITGDIRTDDILDVIFKDFCIGK